MRNRKITAFTLIELLVVIAIIALLISILLPSLQKVKRLARAVVCASNERSIGTALALYAQESDGFLPFVNGTDDDDYMITWDMYIAPFLWPIPSYDAVLPTGRNYVARDMMYCPQAEIDLRGTPAARDGSNGSVLQSHYVMNKSFLKADEYGPGAIQVPAPSYILANKSNARVVHVNMASAKRPGEMYYITEISGTPLNGYFFYGLDDEGESPKYLGVRHDEACNMLYMDGHGERLSLYSLMAAPDYHKSLYYGLAPWVNGN